VVIRFDGQLIGGIDDLHRLLTEERIDRAVPVVVIRGGRLSELTVTPRELERRTGRSALRDSSANQDVDVARTFVRSAKASLTRLAPRTR